MTAGIHACVFGACLYYYFFTRETREKQTSWWPVCFVVILFAMGTINLASNFRTNDEFFIFSVNTPGGPVAFSESAKARHIDTWANSAAIIAAFMADGLLVSKSKLLISPVIQIIVAYPHLCCVGAQCFCHGGSLPHVCSINRYALHALGIAKSCSTDL